MPIFRTGDECTTVADCVEIATCINSPDGFVCFCPHGLYGDGRLSGSGCVGKKFDQTFIQQLSRQCVVQSTCKLVCLRYYDICYISYS